MTIAMTTDELAALLACEPQTIQERARKGDLPGVQFGREWIFPVEALSESLNRIAREQAEQRHR